MASVALLKVLHVITSVGHGGAQRQMVQLANALAGIGYQQQIASLFDRGEFSLRQLRAAVSVHHLGADRSLWSAWRRLRNLVDETQPDMIQAWLYHANIAAILTGSSAPVLWNIGHSLHDLKHDKAMTRVVIGSGALLSRRPAVIIYNSQRSALQHQAAGYDCDRQIVIHNGVDCGKFSRNFELRAKQRAAWGVSENDWVVGLAGRHHPTKGVDIFLRAIAMASGSPTRVHALLIGEGMDAANPAIATVINSLSGSVSIRCLGAQEDMPSILNGLDILVSASSGESSPNIVAEAAAIGTTCIVTDVGESPRLVGDAGIVLPKRDETSIASALRQVVTGGRGSWTDRGIRAACRIRDNYSAERYVEAYDRLYRSVTSGAPARA